jgi:hypothetical protein
MKRILSTVIAIALLLGLGALAVLARGGGDILTPAKAVPVAFAAPSAQEDTNTPVAVPDMQSKDAAPEAVAVGVNKLNNIGMPLIVQSQFSSLGLPYTMFGLAKFIGRPGTDVADIRSWNANQQGFIRCNLSVGATKCSPSVADLPLQPGGNYMLSLTSALPQTVASFVGDVPDQGSLDFSMVGATPGCKLNAITLPLDQAAVTNAVQLVDALGGPTVVFDVRTWNVSNQSFFRCTVKTDGTCSPGVANFTTQIGYPYWVCLKTPTTWPP